MIALLLLLHPPLRAQLPPGRYGPQYHLLPHRKREIIDIPAGKIIALMTSLDTLVNCTRPDRTGLTEYEQFIRETTFAFYIIYSYTIDIR